VRQGSLAFVEDADPGVGHGPPNGQFPLFALVRRGTLGHGGADGTLGRSIDIDELSLLSSHLDQARRTTLAPTEDAAQLG
jgi:hypothetical protein